MNELNITKELVKLDFNNAANTLAMCGDTYKWTSWLLKLSLEDNLLADQITIDFEDGDGLCLFCDDSSEFSTDLVKTVAFQNIISDFRKKLQNLSVSQDSYQELSSVALESYNSSIDWYLGLHKSQISY